MAAVAATGALFFASNGQATPVRIYSLEASTTSVRAEFAVFPYSSTRCKVNVWGWIYTPDGRTRIGGSGRNTVNGCDEGTWSFTVRSPLRRGVQYAFVVIAINNTNDGSPNRHVAIRRFRVP